LVADRGVPATGGHELADEVGERFGQHDGFAAQPRLHLFVAGFDVVEGEAADGGRPLGVEQYEQPSDAVLGLSSWSCSSRRACFQRSSVSSILVGPPHLVAGNSRRVSFCCLAQRTKCPASQRWVTWSLLSQASRSRCWAVSSDRPRGGEPVQQRYGDLEVLLDAAGLLVGGVRGVEPAAQASFQVPDGVAVQQLLFVRAGAGGDGAGGPAFQPGHEAPS
jgi:hypothetical protein